MCSQYPVDQIWYENQQQEVAEIKFSADDGVCLLIYRKSFEVVVVALNRDVYELLELLRLEKTIGEAWEILNNQLRMNDDELTGMLVYLLGLEVFNSISFGSKK